MKRIRKWFLYVLLPNIFPEDFKVRVVAVTIEDSRDEMYFLRMENKVKEAILKDLIDMGKVRLYREPDSLKSGRTCVVATMTTLKV